MEALLVGEGISNITRGFFQGGSKTVMCSIWDIDDKISADILNTFYTIIASGVNSKKSLHLAKLEYLKSKPVFMLHPSAWSGIVFIGSDSIFEFKKKNYNWFFVIASFGLLIYIYSTKKIAY